MNNRNNFEKQMESSGNSKEWQRWQKPESIQLSLVRHWLAVQDTKKMGSVIIQTDS